ncbi:MAG: hypothetical protein FJY73_03395 [Candidatus Eisenbacteria bacterium]|nr:hypothetical protein [Candidatus Eisenbacteria bacterium]
MPYEEFVKQRRRWGNREPQITISKRGNIGINTVCDRTYLKEFDYVVYYYDRDKTTIGIKPMKEELPNAYRIKRYKNGSIVMLSAVAFLDHYQIPREKTRSYPCTWNEKKGMIEVEVG